MRAVYAVSPVLCQRLCMCVCACVYVCMCVSVYVCMCVCVYVCMYAHTHTTHGMRTCMVERRAECTRGGGLGEGTGIGVFAPLTSNDTGVVYQLPYQHLRRMRHSPCAPWRHVGGGIMIIEFEKEEEEEKESLLGGGGSARGEREGGGGRGVGRRGGVDRWHVAC